MLNKFILVRKDFTYSVVQVYDDDFIVQARKLLSSNLVERFYLFDDEYLFFAPLNQPGAVKLNYYATRLNQALHKGKSIYGDVLIAKCAGDDIEGLTSDSINRYMLRLQMYGYYDKNTQIDS